MKCFEFLYFEGAVIIGVRFDFLDEVIGPKKRKTYLNYDVNHKKTKIQNFSIFLNLNCKTSRIFWGSEQLTSSIASRIIVQT